MVVQHWADRSPNLVAYNRFIELQQRHFVSFAMYLKTCVWAGVQAFPLLHLVCNEKGELLSFYLTQGHVDDRNRKHVKKLAENLFGKLFGDKGYLSQALRQMLFADGIQLFTKLRKNLKGHILELKDKILPHKRAIIETINDELKNLCQIEHTRH